MSTKRPPLRRHRSGFQRSVVSALGLLNGRVTLDPGVHELSSADPCESSNTDGEPINDAILLRAASAMMATPGSMPISWRPSASVAGVGIVGGCALAVLGVALFASLHAATHGGATSLTMRVSDLPVAGTTFAVIVALLFTAHELIHGLVLLGFGTRPRFGVQLTARVLPTLYTTAPGERFTRLRFIIIALAPLAVLSVIGALVVVLAPFGGWLVLPMGLHLGGCVGDLWLAAIVLRQPRGTRVEDQRDGVIFFRAVPSQGA